MKKEITKRNKSTKETGMELLNKKIKKAKRLQQFNNKFRR